MGIHNLEQKRFLKHGMTSTKCFYFGFHVFFQNLLFISISKVNYCKIMIDLELCRHICYEEVLLNGILDCVFKLVYIM